MHWITGSYKGKDWPAWHTNRTDRLWTFTRQDYAVDDDQVRLHLRGCYLTASYRQFPNAG